MYQFKSVTKSTSEKYDFRFSPSGYAIVYIDEAAGLISMQTDWGDYSRGWHRNGRGTETLKEFLATCDSGYLLNKFCSRDHFDMDKTRSEMKKLVDDESWNTTDEEKKEILGELDELSCDSVDQVFFMVQDECPNFYEKVMKGDLYGLPAYKDYSPRDRGFFEEIWPAIRDHFKALSESIRR